MLIYKPVGLYDSSSKVDTSRLPDVNDPLFTKSQPRFFFPPQPRFFSSNPGFFFLQPRFFFPPTTGFFPPTPFFSPNPSFFPHHRRRVGVIKRFFFLNYLYRYN